MLMIRLMVALGVAAMLMPEDVNLNIDTAKLEQKETMAVSTVDTLSAANSVYRDVAYFCERNQEACLTGKAIVSNVFAYAQNTIHALSQKQEVEPRETSIDDILTGSIQTYSEN